MKLRIGSGMLAGFLTMTVLLLAGGLVTILYTYRLQSVTAKLLADNLSSLKVAQELEVALFRMRGLVSNYILDEDPQWLAILEQRKKEWKSWMNKAKETARTQEENDILQKISLLFVDYELSLQATLNLKTLGKSQEAKARLLRASREVFDAIYNRCEDFIANNENAMYAAEEKIARANSLVRAAMYGLGLGGIAIGGLLGWVFSRSIVNPIYELVLKVRGATEGELVERVKVARGGELEELDRHVHELIERINTTTADLEKSRHLLARAEKLASLGQVAAGVAHEIRNPLTAIKMLIYALRDDLTGNAEQRNDLAVILNEIGRMERFVQNFLRFARPPDPALAPIELSATVRETLALLAPRLRQRHTAVVDQCRSDLGSILADADQIKQVVMNLVLNAIEAMPEGGQLTAETLRLQTDAGQSSNGKYWMQIKISDTGCGIPHELLDNLFDPFLSGRRDGIGLGLSVAYQIVHRHGGWIEAANNAERGATFTVSLPAEPT